MVPTSAAPARPQPRRFLVRLLVAGTFLAIALPALAQTELTPAERAAREVAAAEAAAAESQVGTPATLTYANRPIVQLRASVLGRVAAERVATSREILEALVQSEVIGPVQVRLVGPAASLELGGRRIAAILPADVDALSGETPSQVGEAAARRLEVALNEAAELRRPRQVLFAVLEALLATAVFCVLAWLLRKARLATTRGLGGAAERGLQKATVADAEFVQSLRLMEYFDRIVAAVILVLGLLLGYFWLTFVLRRFPYTRPWGESLRGFLLERLSRMGASIIDALPGLFTVLVIVLLARFVIRLVSLVFEAIEAERVTIPWMHPETAQPTRKLLTGGLWLFALAIAYPYLPGSQSLAFQGMSVFVGLVVSLGSSGIVNQVMSGLTVTYSRALRMGDFVAVGDVEGTVSEVGTLSTKLRTPSGEDVTIPNALVVSQNVTNYSRFADTGGVFVPTNITIGYDVPWRQVEALLLLAAERSPGVRREPAPRVRQVALEDNYIRYTLLFCLERPQDRRRTLATVHANILDAFNEYGVQITSPSYEADPGTPKIVPRDQWFAAPATAAGSAPATPGATDEP